MQQTVYFTFMPDIWICLRRIDIFILC